LATDVPQILIAKMVECVKTESAFALRDTLVITAKMLTFALERNATAEPAKMVNASARLAGLVKSAINQTLAHEFIA
jgi:hypothetical protein